MNEVIGPEILAALQRRSGLANAGSRPLFGLPPTVPLVLDVDGTLIDGDLLHKSFFWNVLRNPLIVLPCVLWLVRGRAVLKRQLALRCRIDWDRIRLHRNVVALAARENAAGRRVVLATAADAILAGQLASRLGFVDQVFASDGRHNCKGTAKADLLRRSFPAGFIYAGDSKSDLGVWRYASGMIVVNARRRVASAARRLKRPILEMRDRLYVSLPQ
jgi:phosphoserine phosphatase